VATSSVKLETTPTWALSLLSEFIRASSIQDYKSKELNQRLALFRV
jgi:hypothetical protein